MAKRIGGFVVVVIVGLLSGVVPAQAAHNSEQVVFSVKPQFVGGTLDQPLGFWVWCEADSTNPYHGFCNGSMYFYEFGPSEHVTGTISEPTEGTYQMALNSSDIACWLTNQSHTSGPTNDITVTCTSPASGTGTAHNAVVNVTGP